MWIINHIPKSPQRLRFKMSKISLISAMSEHGVIGAHNRLPWDIPEELQYFRQVTAHKPVVMGRKTFESIGRLLPHRHNIVLSRDKDFQEKCADFKKNAASSKDIKDTATLDVVGSVEETLDLLRNSDDLMVIGGFEIYKLFMPLATHLYLSTIIGHYTGDTFFPVVDWSQWSLVSEQAHKDFIARIFDRKIRA